ncbi:MAG: hypothetical protein H6741_05795 [Alphaproteobacteria bacterium]|nr:hypothetical protein [Alphaproteobacteria bacterium]MCB9792220.1 hypothetical protein [Alphaproteobacteria bacterium]
MAMLIGVGGTGQHVASAAARLAHLGALSELEVFIIDADDGSELTRGLTSFGGTSDTQDHPLRSLDFLPPVPADEAREKHFSDLFLQGAGAPEQELFEAFFDPPSARVNIEHGMYGNPAVGATVFANAAGEKIDGMLARATNAEQILVTGSFVGGTGAGVTHQLLRKLKDKGCSGKTFLAALLPWHQPDRPVDAKVPLHEASMTANMRFGVDYLYNNSRHFVQGACLLGVPSDGDAGLGAAKVQVGVNKEYPHLFHAFACHYLQHAPSAKVTIDNPHALFTYLWDPAAQNWLLDQVWAGGHTLRWYLQRATGVKAVLDHLLSAEVAEEFADSFGWFGAKKDTYSLALWQTVKDNVVQGKPKTLAGEVWSELAQERARIEHDLSWARSLFGALPEHAEVKRFQEDALAYTREIATAPLGPDAGGRKRDAQAIAAWFTGQASAWFGAKLGGS